MAFSATAPLVFLISKHRKVVTSNRKNEVLFKSPAIPFQRNRHEQGTDFVTVFSRK